MTLRSDIPQHLPRRDGDLVLPAEPEEFPLDPRETALIVVDMQNAYASKGGYIDLAGFDLSGAQAVRERVVRCVAAARAMGSLVVFFRNGFDTALAEAGGPGSPNWWKSNALKLMRERPELRGQLITKGGWDHALIEELKPEPDDIVLDKARYGGFTGTALEPMLRARGIRNLVFCGIATNVCVESTLREAFHREFFCVLLEDACWPGGPPELHAATVFNVRTFFGWVAKSGAYAALTNRG